MARKSSSSDQLLWLLNATLVTQDEERRIFKGHLLIRNNKIEKITRRLPGKLPKKTQSLDCSGLVILPGFVQTHIHLCQTLFKNLADDLELLDWLRTRIWPMEACHTAQTLEVSAQLGIFELLSSGTTCLLDMGTVRHTESIFQVAKKTGIRANIGKCLMDHPENTPEYLRESTTEALSEAIALIQKWNHAEEDRIRASFAPRFAISCTKHLLSEVARLSQVHQTLIHTHASENRSEIQMVREMTSQENIEYLRSLGLTSPQLVLAHCVWLNDREVDILSESQSNVSHCPSSNLKLASGIADVPKLLDRNINVSLGADGAPCNNTLNAFQEMRTAALIQKPIHGPTSMNAQTVLDMATRNGAKALAWDDDIGSIEMGKKADLVGLDLRSVDSGAYSPSEIVSALVYSASPQNVKWTMVDGKMVYRNSRVRGISRPQLLDAAEKARRKIQLQAHKL